ncbi:YcaO-like family protein [Streptomyces spiramenti]|uniref:YcaO-like family protein n=1 Tax=Streptomyces spiramenti TaxID=2720606 RepID=A0ABX1AL20_9ACTN|nr:YcaO-like family protein [Streptomyces spiramenti]NJP65760.1 YcaO-like family protein [Streptomyces spiramenti]
MSTPRSPTRPWAAELFHPFPQAPDVVFARVAARSALFTAGTTTSTRADTGTGTGAGTGTAGAGGPGRSDGSDVVTGSAAGHDPDDVSPRATGELVERIGNITAGRAAEAELRVTASYHELRLAGRPALDPAPLVGRPGTAVDARETPRLWVTGRSLSTGRELLVPAGAVYLRHRPPAEPDIGTGSTGLAAHPDPIAATHHAVWEILERDLIRRSWYGEAGAPTVAPHLRLRPTLRASLAALGLTATLLLVPAPAGVGCVAACLHDANGEGQTFGAACGPEGHGPTAERAAEKAVYEALMVRWSMGTRVARRTWQSWAGTTPPRTALHHALWTFHRQDSLRLWLADAPAASSGTRRQRALPAPAAVLADHTGQEVVAVPTPSRQSLETGLQVMRVVAPGALPLPAGPRGPGGALRTHRPHPFG